MSTPSPRDIQEACDTLAKKGGAHESERAKMVTGSGSLTPAH